MRRIILMTCLVPLGCFGEVTNEPFEPGTGVIRGTLSGELDLDRAWVTIVGRPELETRPDATGAFVIEGAPSGTVELAASTGRGRAVRRSVEVYNQRDVDVRLDSAPALVVSGRVAFEDLVTDMAPARVFVVGLPAETMTTDGGFFTFDSLPSGCHEIVAARPGYADRPVDTCGDSGELVDVNHRLRRDDVVNRKAAICAPCHRATDCESDLCIDRAGESVCSRTCDEQHPCPDGFLCEQLESRDGRVCIPRASSCTALSDLAHGRECDVPEDCGLNGVADAVCSPQHRCSVPCDEAHACPLDTTCHLETDMARGYCL